MQLTPASHSNQVEQGRENSWLFNEQKYCHVDWQRFLTDFVGFYHMDHVWASGRLYHRQNSSTDWYWTGEVRDCSTQGMLVQPQHTAVKPV